mmetsp:Transcript_18024/g.50043  ORF Transcript_18024/g.50043 Transcript_18024/m.50043 type:complete len:450 (+) Transcript_18024:161-1510(+)
MPTMKLQVSIYVLCCLLATERLNAFVVVSPTNNNHHRMPAVPQISRTSPQSSSPKMIPSFPSSYSWHSHSHSSSSHLFASSMTSSLNEKVMEKLPSKKVVDAVIESKTQSIVASDVATRAGVSISQARKDLTTLASLSRGDISVSADGELIYEFPGDLNGVLSSNSAKYKVRQSFEKAWPSIFWGLRVSFGVALVASVVLVFSAIVVLQTSSNSSSDDRDDRRGGGMGFRGGFWGPTPFDFFYYRPYGYYGYYGQTMDGVVRDPEDMGFLESVFSFVFGDGNPNAGLEEKRLSLAAQMIRDNEGAVTAEQLAPYCDAPNPSSESLSGSLSSSSSSSSPSSLSSSSSSLANSHCLVVTVTVAAAAVAWLPVPEHFPLKLDPSFAHQVCLFLDGGQLGRFLAGRFRVRVRVFLPLPPPRLLFACASFLPPAFREQSPPSRWPPYSRPGRVS